MDANSTERLTIYVSIRQVFFTPLFAVVILVSFWLGWSREVSAEEFVVYSVYNQLDLGNANEPPTKDFFVNMGSAHGIRIGSTLDVLRKSPTYDLINEKLQRDVSFPIATLKVIHVEGNVAIARLDKMNPPESTPTISPRAVMVGDLVRPKK